MRKLIAFEQVSVDGFFTTPSGDMAWSHRPDDDLEFRDFIAGNATSGGELMFGRVTYEHMAAFWPTAMAAKQFPIVAKQMNALPKYVASRTLATADWNKTRVLAGDLVDAVRALKASPGPGIAILGSGSLVAQLSAAGLIDEYQLVVIPVALGAGRTLFAPSAAGARPRARQDARVSQRQRAQRLRAARVIGTRTDTGDGATLCFRRTYAHAPALVWDAIATPEGLAGWLMCTDVVLDGRIGGSLAMVSGPGRFPSTGALLPWDPPRVLEYEWNVAPTAEMARGERAIFRYELTARDDSTLLVVTVRKFSRGTAAGFLPGLHALLGRLDAQLARRALPDWHARFAELLADYPAWSAHATAADE